MTYIPEVGRLKLAAAEMLKGLKRPEPSGFDDEHIDLMAEDYELFVAPDEARMSRRNVDRNLDQILTATKDLQCVMRVRRDDGLIDAFHANAEKGMTLAKFERALDALVVAAEKCRLERGVDGRPTSDQRLAIATKLAEDFSALTGSQPTLSKKPGINFCACIARMFRELRLDATDNSVRHYARRAIEAVRETSNTVAS